MSIENGPPGFRITVTVEPSDVDELAHANNVAYLRWILGAATAHWEVLRAEAPGEVVADVAWVVIRHEVDYLAPAFAGEPLEVVTWVPSCTATTCERCAEVRRSSDGLLLARSASSYCVIDRSTGKPRRLTEPLRLAIGGPPMGRRDKTARAFPDRPARVRAT